MTDLDGVNRRLDELSERLRVLEAGGTTPAGADHNGVPAAGTDAADVFWALNGLKQRTGVGLGGIIYAGAVTVPAGPVEWQIGTSTEQILESDWTQLAPSLAALGNPVRLSLLHTILGGASSVTELATGEGMGTTGQLYHHLGQLVSHGWLSAAGRGQYSIPPERVVPLLVILTAARRIV